MEIAENKVVSLIYELRKDNNEGDVVESLTKDNPLTFLFGTGNLLPEFESNIQGLKEGDSFSFSLSSEQAYGQKEEDAIIDVPISAFEVDGKLDETLVKVGNSVPMVDRDGRRLNGVINDISSESVKMDFNHPMAGENLHFSGVITDIREASENEITHGHVHSEGSCKGCSHDDCGEHC